MTRQRWTLALVAAAALAPLAVLAQGSKSEDKKGDDKGWVAIFNGKDLKGWEAYDGKGKQADVSKNWTVEDGVIHGHGPVSHLFSPRGDYKNFRYRAEVKIGDGSNSGMYFRTAKGPGFPKGYEAQVNSSHGDPVRSGSLYNFVKVLDKLVPPDTWFTQTIEANGNHIKIWVNDKQTVDFVDEKNTYKEGYFAFQQHNDGSHVWIRKVEVKELP